MHTLRRPWQSPLGKVCPKSYVLCSEECDHCALRPGESLVDSHKKVNTSTDVVAASGLEPYNRGYLLVLLRYLIAV